jgi:hypothetical protein
MLHKFFQIKGITYAENALGMQAVHCDLDCMDTIEDYQLSFTRDEWDYCWREATIFYDFWTKSWKQSITGFIHDCRLRLRKLSQTASPCPSCIPFDIKTTMLIVLAALCQCIRDHPYIHYDVVMSDVVAGGKLAASFHVRPLDFFPFASA